MTGGEQRGFFGNGAAAERLRRWRSRAEEVEGSGEGTEWRVGARGSVPTRLSRSAAAHPATWPAPGGARRAPRAGERGEGKRAALSGWAETEAGRPSSVCPLSLLFEFLFSNSF